LVRRFLPQRSPTRDFRPPARCELRRGPAARGLFLDSRGPGVLPLPLRHPVLRLVLPLLLLPLLLSLLLPVLLLSVSATVLLRHVPLPLSVSLSPPLPARRWFRGRRGHSGRLRRRRDASGRVGGRERRRRRTVRVRQARRRASQDLRSAGRRGEGAGRIQD